MSASSSRIMIAPAEPDRPLSDRLVDRLLGWWDIGGGRGLRRGIRDAAHACVTRLRTLAAPALKKPWVAATVCGLGSAKRWLAKAFSSDLPTPPLRREELRATIATEAGDVAPAQPTPAVPRPATVTRSPTGELRPRTASSITRPVITPVTVAEPTVNVMTTTLRCWNCHQRHRARTPRRGGCFHCGQCDQTMLVVDPIIGLTCAIGDAHERGIQLNREANETDAIVRPSLI